jgi:hypothetical protein
MTIHTLRIWVWACQESYLHSELYFRFERCSVVIPIRVTYLSWCFHGIIVLSNNIGIIQSGPKINWLVSKMHAKLRWKLLYYLQNLPKFFEMMFSMFNRQLTMLWCRSANWLAGLNLNIPVITRECFTLTGFGPLCIAFNSLYDPLLFQFLPARPW